MTQYAKVDSLSVAYLFSSITFTAALFCFHRAVSEKHQRKVTITDDTSFYTSSEPDGVFHAYFI